MDADKSIPKSSANDQNIDGSASMTAMTENRSETEEKPGVNNVATVSTRNQKKTESSSSRITLSTISSSSGNESELNNCLEFSDSDTSSDFKLSELFYAKPKDANSRRKRGRPRKLDQQFYFNRTPAKSDSSEEKQEKRKRGRPPKIKVPSVHNKIEIPNYSDADSMDSTFSKSFNTSQENPSKRGRGRPRKHPDAPVKIKILGRKRGRPRKSEVLADIKNDSSFRESNLGRGSFTEPRNGFRRSARVISPEYNSPSPVKQRKTINIPMEIPGEDHIPHFDEKGAVADLLAFYKSVPEDKVPLFHMQIKTFIITLKEIVPYFTRDSSPRI